MVIKTGNIKLIIGPMFASKSTELIAHMRRNIIAKKKCAIIKYSSDTRYTNESVIISHDGAKLELSKSFSVEKLENCADQISSCDIEVVGIDEGQFFPDVVKYADEWANRGIKVIISALDGDYLRNPFKNIIDLIPRCEEVVKLRAICMKCYSESAAFSHRIIESNETIVIGGSDKYIPLCRGCLNEHTIS